MPLTLTFTNAGLARFTAAQLGNGADLRVSAIGLTDNAIVVAPTLTALPGEFRRVATVSGAQVDNNIVHLIVRDDEAVTYAFRAFALYLSDGTLFAVYGQADRIMQKAAGASNMLAVDIAFPAANIATVSFGDTNFLNPPATSTTKGVVELATDAETIAGVDTSRAVTPTGLAARLAQILTGTNDQIAAILATIAKLVTANRRVNTTGLATGGRALDGDVTIDVPAASAAEADAGAVTTKALTPASLANVLASIVARVPLARRVDTTGLAIGGNALNTDITISVPAATAAQLLAGSAGNVAATPAALTAAGVVYLVESKSDGANRYRRFSDGSVEMMGVSALPGSEAAFTLNFPWAFPTACDGIWTTIINSGQSNDGQSTVQEVSLSAASAQLYAQNHKTPTADAAGGFRWFARGR
ncbi:hypothetical protein EQZ23_17850 [Sphingomonas sp. UV9]|uniref:gp53-like domain-containing protein n=1 Tax=Sphingomonas sp. UV9 TaxID=1851410 RepID=UPI000FFC5C2A|nr:hypothetical protein [Sphingomonas sp. UV9]RXD02486.1 hypothetical protein EQZ23_17850 [Sphingomonas sp. UV9]